MTYDCDIYPIQSMIEGLISMKRQLYLGQSPDGQNPPILTFKLCSNSLKESANIVFRDNVHCHLFHSVPLYALRYHLTPS